MFAFNPTIADRLEKATAKRDRLTEKFIKEIDPLRTEVSQLEAAQTAEITAYILNQGREALLDPAQAKELYLLEQEYGGLIDPVFMALAEVMGVHPYLNEDHMRRHPECPILLYSVSLPRNEKADEDLTLSLESLIAPVVAVQWSIAQDYGVDAVRVYIVGGGSHKYVSYDGAAWYLGEDKFGEVPADLIPFNSLSEALTFISEDNS